MLAGITGSAAYLVDGIVHDIRPGTVIWALAGQQHFLLSESPEFDMWVALVSSRILTREHDMLHAIAVAQTASTTAPTKAAGLRLWLAQAWAHWHLAANDAGRHIHPAVTRAAQIWYQDPERRLKDVARDAGLSPGRLGRLFKEQIGKDVVTYRTDQKMRLFEIIRSRAPRLSLTAAALDAGFGSYTQFYRAWLARFGTHPNDRKFR